MRRTNDGTITANDARHFRNKVKKYREAEKRISKTRSQRKKKA